MDPFLQSVRSVLRSGATEATVRSSDGSYTAALYPYGKSKLQNIIIHIKKRFSKKDLRVLKTFCAEYNKCYICLYCRQQFIFDDLLSFEIYHNKFYIHTNPIAHSYSFAVLGGMTRKVIVVLSTTFNQTTHFLFCKKQNNKCVVFPNRKLDYEDVADDDLTYEKSYLQCAARCVAEETGIEIDPTNFTNLGFVDRPTTLFGVEYPNKTALFGYHIKNLPQIPPAMIMTELGTLNTNLVRNSASWYERIIDFIIKIRSEVYLRPTPYVCSLDYENWLLTFYPKNLRFPLTGQ